ncbi:MAG: universal stress protein [Parvibaculales bacterium]
MDINQHLQRKFLVVVDGTPEVYAALRFAARRAHGTGGKVALLLLLAPGEGGHWLGVDSLMKEEALEEAERILGEHSALVELLGVEKPKTHIREGQPVEEIVKLINEDPTISTLVLATRAGQNDAQPTTAPKTAPGPLVSAIAGGRVGVDIPVTIVPGALSNEEIDALT